MKRANPSYRLQLIKEVALRKQSSTLDPMANYIRTLISKKSDKKSLKETKRSFTGAHFDEHAGGWVSDRWELNK